MLKFLNKREASVSIFLLIIMLPMFVFSFGIVDICKIMMAKDVMQDASDLAASSALTAYDKTLKDIYGLLATSSTEAELTDKIQEYYVTTLEASGVQLSKDDKQFVQNLLRDLIGSGIDEEALSNNQNLLNVHSEQKDNKAITASPVNASAISNPAVMKRQIIEYSKYRGPVQLASGMLEKLGVLSDTQNQTNATQKKIEFEKELSSVGETAQELYTLFRIYFYNAERLECLCEYYKTPHTKHPAFEMIYSGTDYQKTEQTNVNKFAFPANYKIDKSHESVSAPLTRSLSSYMIDDHLNTYIDDIGGALELLIICYPFYKSHGKLRSADAISAGDIPDSPAELEKKITELTKTDSPLSNAVQIASKAQADQLGQFWFGDISQASYDSRKLDIAKNKLDFLNIYLPIYNSQFSDSGICDGFAKDLVTFRKCYEKAEKLTEKFDKKNKDYDALVSLSAALSDPDVKSAQKFLDYQEKIENSIWALSSSGEGIFDYYSGQILEIYYEIYQQYLLLDKITTDGTLDKLYSKLDTAKTAAETYKNAVNNVGTDSIKTSMSSQCDSETSTLVDLKEEDCEKLKAEVNKQKEEYKKWLDYIRGIAVLNNAFVGKANSLSSPVSAQNNTADISKYLLSSSDMFQRIVNYTTDKGNYHLSGVFNTGGYLITKPPVPSCSMKSWTSGEEPIQKNPLFIKLKEMAEPSDKTKKNQTAKNEVQNLGETKTDGDGNTVSSKNSEPSTDNTSASGSSGGSTGGSSSGNSTPEKQLPDFYEISNEIKTFEEYYSSNAGSSGSTVNKNTSSLNGKGSDDQVSQGAIDSLAAVGKQLASLAEAARDDLLLTEYMTSQFSCHTTDLKDGIKNTDKKTMETTMTGMLYPEYSSLYKCEVEYILYGQDSNLKNVAAASAIIFGIRFALDLIYSFTDQEIRAFTLSAATAASGIFPFAIPLIQTVIHIGLSIAEAGFDVEELLNGYTLPIFKTSDTWVFKPSGLAKKAAEKTLTTLVNYGIDAASEGALKLIDDVKNKADGKIDETSKEFQDYVDKQANEIKSKINSEIKQPINEKIQQLMLTARDKSESAKAQLKADLKTELGNLKTSLYNSLGLNDIGDDLLKRAEKSVLDKLNTDQIAESAVDNLESLITAATGAPSSEEEWSAATQKLQDTLDEKVFQKLNKLIDDAVTSIKNAEDGIKTRTKNTLNSLSEKVKEGTINGADELKNALNEEISSAFSGSSQKVSLQKGSQKGFTQSSKLSNILTMNYKDYLYVFMLIGFCTPAETGMLERAAKVMEVNCRKGGAGDSYSLNSTATLITTDASASVRTVFYGAVFKDGKLDLSGKPDRYTFSCRSYAGY